MSIRRHTYDRLHHYVAANKDVTGCGLVEKLLADFLDAQGVPDDVETRTPKRNRPVKATAIHPACFTF